MRNVLFWGRRLLLATAVFLLAGCSGMRLIDSDVVSHARWQGPPAGPGSTYRFERLPSQQTAVTPSSEIGQDQLEALAQSALNKLGLVHYPQAALLVVQLSTTTVVQPGYSGGWPGFPGVSIGAGTAGGHIGMVFPMARYEPPLYIREVQIILRDSRSLAVVYETRARHSGPWADGRALIPAMLDAALSGFPSPPAGPRRVNVQIPR
jgi:hypothetical protein